ncbi:MAG TPA: right-handed parallel beta-helix repeat-containing protein [Firmicutes bacterium]|nr:right-handed parallel beta-helix repeat-containing protein [Bacillota bacterium]
MTLPMTANIRDFGAVGDGAADDTAAIQAAVDACPPGGILYVPEGVFPCADIRVKPHITIQGAGNWGYRDESNCHSRLTPAVETAACLLDVTDAVGATIVGLALDGKGCGKEMHGIQIAKTGTYGREEDAIRIEKCRVSDFSGDALHLHHVWCATVQGNMLGGSRNGLYIDGWDLFIYDNWLTANRGCGVYGRSQRNTAVVFQGNRVEWNGRQGIDSEGGVTWVLTGNHFDRNGREGARFLDAKHINITGNAFVRDGWRATGEERSVGLTVENGKGISIQSNVFRSLGGDGGKERHSPDYDIQLSRLDTAVVRGNVMYQAAVVQNILDWGGHTNLVLADNVGSLAQGDC